MAREPTEALEAKAALQQVILFAAKYGNVQEFTYLLPLGGNISHGIDVLSHVAPLKLKLKNV